MSTAYAGVATAGDNVALPEALLSVYSLDIQHTAMGVMRFAEFAVQKTELGVLPGQTITFTRYANITRGGALSESADMDLQSLDASTSSITVTEYGNAIGVTEKLLQLSYDDVLKEAAVLLGRDYAVTTDLMLRDSLTGLGSVIYSGSASSIGTLAAAEYFDVEMIRDGVEVLQTNNTPKFNGDFYVSFIHPHQAAYLKRDPDWVSANNYANTRALFNGELGRWEDTVFIATTHARNGAAAAADAGYHVSMDGTGADGQHVYEGMLFGDACLAWAEALPCEMRESGVMDFGRRHGIAWYSIMGSGLLFNNYGVLLRSS